MANVRKRGNSWGYRVYIGRDFITKKQKFESQDGFPSKRAALAAAKEVEIKVAKGKYIKASDMLFRELATKWIDSYAQQSKGSSVSSRKRPMKLLLDQFGEIPISKITKAMYHEYLNELAVNKSYSYMESIHSTGNLIFKHAMKLEILEKCPTEDYRIPKKPKTYMEQLEEVKGKYLEPDELIKVLDIIEEHAHFQDKVFFFLLAYTGMRAGEAVTLCWNDFNFQEQTVRISKTYDDINVNNKRIYQITDPKSSSANRNIHISTEIIELLQEYQQSHHVLSHSKEYPFVFTCSEGYPRYIKYWNHRLKTLSKHWPEIKKSVTTHIFRHTHTTLLLSQKGINIKAVQERLGHKDIRTTLNTYTHVTKETEKETSHQFSELMKDLRN